MNRYCSTNMLKLDLLWKEYCSSSCYSCSLSFFSSASSHSSSLSPLPLIFLLHLVLVLFILLLHHHAPTVSRAYKWQTFCHLYHIHALWYFEKQQKIQHVHFMSMVHICHQVVTKVRQLRWYLFHISSVDSCVHSYLSISVMVHMNTDIPICIIAFLSVGSYALSTL